MKTDPRCPSYSGPITIETVWQGWMAYCPDCYDGAPDSPTRLNLGTSFRSAQGAVDDLFDRLSHVAKREAASEETMSRGPNDYYGPTELKP